VADPQSSVVEAGFHALSSRLSPLPKLLERAALNADEDIEHVHRLRVGTRRADAAITEFSDILEEAETREITASLKQIRKAAGRARDLDVLIQRHRKDPDILKRLRPKRKRAQKKIKRVFRDLQQTGELTTRIQHVLQSVPSESNLRRDETFRAWAAQRLEAKVATFLEAWPLGSDDLEALHRFRIRAKALRYTIELFASVFPAQLKSELYPRVEQLQNVLGDINDHHVALRKFDRWESDDDLAALKSETESALEERLHQFQQCHGTNARDEFKRIAESCW